jgi:hypothetical protein
MSDPQIEYIDVEVRPSQNYQSVGFTARVSFKEPVSMEQAKFEADLIYDELASLALKRVEELSALRPAKETSFVVEKRGADTSDAEWRLAHKPNGAGSFKYIPSASFSKRDFIDKAMEKLTEMGMDTEQVVVFDDRGGDRGLERGEQHYSAGKVKVRPDTQYAAAMNGKAIIGSVDFGDSGEIRVSISRDGKSALNAIKIAGQLSSMDATPEPTPF